MKATLILDDGSQFAGRSFGYEAPVAGEVVFNTAMMGYPESLTDPSYAGQILVMTFPLVGNYGVPSDALDETTGLSAFYESDRIHVRALVCSDYSEQYSHWNASRSLAQWMKDEHVVGIEGIDTRELTKLLREKGSMKGKILMEGSADIPFEDPNLVNQVALVSTREVLHYPSQRSAEGKPKEVCLVDMGTKQNIIRELLRYNVNITVVPWDYDFNNPPAVPGDSLAGLPSDFDGLFISNGPGDPNLCQATVKHVREFMKTDKPICGICMGNQILSLAAGAKVSKLKYGHRGHNQPVRLMQDGQPTNQCFITSQNHGFAVDNDTIPADWEPLFINMNDGSNEGIRHKTMPWFSAQFHPEAASGPTDTEWLFGTFVAALCGSTPTPSASSLESKVFSSLESKVFESFRDLSRPFDQNTASESPCPSVSPRTVLLLGSGALKIGEAGEFDYSGSQALKAMREEGIRTILINPNIATVQTSEGVADRIYFLPVTPFFVEKVIEKERPDGILLAFGGQTALNCGVELYKGGVLEKYNVKVLGTPVQAIIDTEDRELFVRKLDEIGVKTIKSEACETIEAARAAAASLGYPVILRAAYALGGLGSGFCDNEEELDRLAEKAFSFSPQVLVEKSLKGWKEIEYEVVRDRYDNCITVCNMENFDPLGIHTGESIVIAPSQTLTNSEYHKLRALSIKIIRHIGIVGECNVQYAFDPQSEDYRVIEVNARLSRSSALASKATGYPLAFVAAKLGLGYGLFDLKNSVTKTTSAFFEPALDYVVCKIPRWDLGKFHGVDRELGSSMKSVGEVMAIGRTFEEAIQKGLRMIGQGMHGFVGNKELKVEDIDAALKAPTDKRIFVIEKAFFAGYTIDQIHELTKIDRWFLQKLKHIYDINTALTPALPLKGEGDLESVLPAAKLREAKVYGFTDFQIARAMKMEKVMDIEEAMLKVRQYRKSLGIIPYVKQIDTLAGEFPAQTNYLYLTYSAVAHDITPPQPFCPPSQSEIAPLAVTRNANGHSSFGSCSPAGEGALESPLSNSKTDYKTPSPAGEGRGGVIVLGSGAYRIGSSVEFDWCGVQALNTIRKEGYRSVMINYNPETVSTDYDMCDRLYFDELTFERVMDIYEFENGSAVKGDFSSPSPAGEGWGGVLGIIVSTGGQIPNNLAVKLDAQGVPLLGTQAKYIDNAEDRDKFSAMLDRIGVDQPEWSALTSMDDVNAFVQKVGFPVLVRPSYVLSGAAMNVCSNQDELERFLRLAANVSQKHPVVVSKFMQNTKEVEMDAVAKDGEIIAYAISEHIEYAGVHSGDATIQFPAQKLYVETVRRIKRISGQIARELKISGPFNIQYLARENEIKVIECNLRASRSFPFVSKVLKLNLIELATRVMLGLPVERPSKSIFDFDYVGIKASQFSFNRLQKSDPVLGVDMASTGEVGCLGEDTNCAIMKSMLSVGHRIPKPGGAVLLSTGGAKQKAAMLDVAKELVDCGYYLYATPGTSKYLSENGIPNTLVLWPSDEGSDSKAPSPAGEGRGGVLSLLHAHEIDLVVNIPKDLTVHELTNGYKIRRAAVDLNIPLITNSRLASAFIHAFCTMTPDDLAIRAWDEYN